MDIYRNDRSDFDIKSHIWLVFLSGKYRESEIPGKYGTGKFSVGDWHLYHTYHHKLCGTCTSGGDICNRCRSGIWTGTWNHLLLRSDYTWGYGSICCRKIFLQDIIKPMAMKNKYLKNGYLMSLEIMKYLF